MRSFKYHPHGSVLFITFALEEGLLLLPNPLCEAVIKSCLARAQHLYPVRICHIGVEGTHIHLVAVVENPNHVADFMRYFKCESAHMLNRVLGRRKRTVWCEGYDSPIVLTPIRALLAICYLYSNPSKDNLEVSIDSYPGLTSWNMFMEKSLTRQWKQIRRSQLKALPKDAHNLRGYSKEAERILTESKTTHTFTLEPDAWLEALGIGDPEERLTYNKKIVQRVRLLEQRAAKKRAERGRTVIGRRRLINQRLDTSYQPRRSGKRMWCLSENRSLRRAFIGFLKELWYKAREVRKRWLIGDFSQPYPMGLYPPLLPKLTEPLAVW